MDYRPKELLEGSKNIMVIELSIPAGGEMYTQEEVKNNLLSHCCVGAGLQLMGDA